MEVGQVFTIEPMINLGTHNLDHWKDDWTAVTMDGRRSAQFEETLVYVDNLRFRRVASHEASLTAVSLKRATTS